MSPGQEILAPAFASRAEARPVIQSALTHYRTAKRATIQVMADLRRLQDGQVHILYGERNFSIWAENTFEGLAQGNVRQLTRAGAVALELDRRGLLDLRKPEGIGTTGLRELSVVANDFDDDKMVEVFLTAKSLLDPENTKSGGGKEVSGVAVKAAMRLLMPPTNEELIAPEQEPDEFDDIPDAPDQPPKVWELIERIRDLAWDLPETVGELREANRQLEAELKGESAASDEDWEGSAR
jgi:hypothetical protein